MSEYSPESWVIVKIYTSKSDTTIYRILSSWYGDFLRGDSWRLSSGITKIEEKENEYIVHNESGSIYYLQKGVVWMSSYAERVYKSFQKQIEELNDGSTIEIVDISGVEC